MGNEKLWAAKPLAGDRIGQKEMRLTQSPISCGHNIFFFVDITSFFCGHNIIFSEDSECLEYIK